MFNIKLAVFPQSAEDHKRIRKDKYDATKKYPEFGGIANVPVSEVPALIKYLTHATPDYDDYLKQEVVPLRASGYMNESKGGKKYLGLQLTSDYNKQQEVNQGKSISANKDADKPAVPETSKENSNWF